jgi:hypothetical protein
MSRNHLPVSLYHYTGRNTKAVCVSVGPIDLYFSYTTVIAVRAPGFGLSIMKNYWGPTTGRHMNEILPMADEDRMPREEFEAKLLKILAHYGLTEIAAVDNPVEV